MTSVSSLVPRLAAFGLLAGALAVPACSRQSAESEEVSGQTIAVTVQAARLASLRDVVSAGGTVVPSSIADFVVTASEACEIAELPKKEGDTVQAGDVLVRLDVPAIATEIATRQLELAEATTRFENAKAEEARLNRLFSQGIAARNLWEAARSALAAAETNLNQVRARVDAARALEATTIIRARFAGVVAKVWHAAGDVVAGGGADPILRVIDPARLQVALQVPADKADRVTQGQTAAVQTGTGTEAAIVAQKAPPAGAGAPTVEVRLNFIAPSALPVDAIVQAEIVLEDRQNVLVVPAGAVQQGESGSFVWIATASETAERRDVRVGLTATGLTQIVSGLAVGEQVIVTGIAQLADGMAITISK